MSEYTVTFDEQECVRLMDCLQYARENAVTSEEQIMIGHIQTKVRNAEKDQ